MSWVSATKRVAWGADGRVEVPGPPESRLGAGGCSSGCTRNAQVAAGDGHCIGGRGKPGLGEPLRSWGGAQQVQGQDGEAGSHLRAVEVSHIACV